MTPRVRAVEIHEEEAQKIRRVMQRRKEGEGGGRRGKNLLISGISPESRPTDDDTCSEIKCIDMA